MIKTLPLESIHKELGAHFFEFAGWKTPMKYTSSLKETLAVREAAGFFDVSHMARFIIEGRDALAFLNWATTSNLLVEEGRTRYTLTLNYEGGIKDDNVAFLIEPILFIVNAANREKIFNWFNSLVEDRGLNVEVKDVTEETVMIAVQGPLAREKVHEILKTEIKMRKFRVREIEIEGERVLVSRTGYTGEDGYELIFWNVDLAEKFVRRLVKLGIMPCGLVARDILRLEAGLVLYGNDIDEKTNPLEAKLDFAVDMKKEFLGKDALERADIERLRVGLLSEDKKAPRRGNEILNSQGEVVGVVTSGTYSPTVKRGIGMGYVKEEFTDLGTELIVKGVREIRVRVNKMPFYDETKYGWRRASKPRVTS